MRGTRWLILLAIGAILGGVGLTYRMRMTALEREAPPRPKALPLDLASSAENWVWTQSMPGEGRPAVRIEARKYGQSKDNSRIALEGVELRIFHKSEGRYDRVRSARAEFQTAEKRLYSEDEVEITLGLPVEGEPRSTPVSIRSSGVAFDSATGQAWTERPTEFTFENGVGRSVGASYDPMAKRVHMTSQAVVDWKAAGPRSKPIRVETGDLTYEEAQGKIWLRPWARMTRDRTVIESAAAVLTLVDGVIRKVESVQAHGRDRYPGRDLEYGAEEMWAELSPEGAVTKVTGFRNARVVSTADRSATTVTAERVDLEFVEARGESVLTRALATGNAVLESRPLPAAGTNPPETRFLRGETIAVAMRTGGREIEKVETPGPGILEFRPNTAAQRHRTLEGERLLIGYGSMNTIESFQAVNVTTRTEPTAAESKRRRTTAVTRSRNLRAQFAKGQLARLEQWEEFEYQEADRKARAGRAILEQASNLLLLEERARIEDAGGSTAADHIRLDQETGDFTATGSVNSSRLPDSKPGSGMLSGREPLQAVAQKMTSTRRNRLVVYEGGAVLWQGANRVRADRVEIDREKRVLTATGNVTTEFLDPPDPKTGGGPRFTTVRAAGLVYTEADRMAHYTGGAMMSRPGLDVKGAEIRALLSEQGGGAASVERAHADGAAEIVRSSPGRTSTFRGEHAVYHAADQRIVVNGGDSHLADSAKGVVRGSELTYYANDDRLLVTGAPGQPVKSRIRRK